MITFDEVKQLKLYIMHNLHLVRINATSPEQACNQVENEVMDFGNENNWRSIGGCVSEDNEIYDHDSYSRWSPSNETEDGIKVYGSIEALNERVREWLKSDQEEYYRKDLIDAIDSGEKKLSEITDRMELYAIGEYIEKRKGLTELTKAFDEFDVLEDEYRGYKYDECGLTSMDYSEKGEGEKTYIVFIDMHS
jgi:hypothetical protein